MSIYTTISVTYKENTYNFKNNLRQNKGSIHIFKKTTSSFLINFIKYRVVSIFHYVRLYKA